MGVKAHNNSTDSPKVIEVGEIDTRAPFQSVKAAVSLFGEGSFSAEKPTARKTKPLLTERVFVQETQLHLAQKELNSLKDQLKNAELTKAQALSELERAKKMAEDLTQKLNVINESKDNSVKATEAAKSQAMQIKEANSANHAGENGAAKIELDSARQQYASAISELDAAKQELWKLRQDFESSLDAKVSALRRAEKAEQAKVANTDRASQLAKEIASVQDSLLHVKLATSQAREEESKIMSDKDSQRQAYKHLLEEAERKLLSLKKEFDPKLVGELERKLSETELEIGSVQKEMETAKVSEMESVRTVTMDLDDAKSVLQKVAEEEGSLRSLEESLKLELEQVRKEHLELKEKEAETESVAGNLHIELQKTKSELEVALASESKARAASDDLISTLQQLNSESESARREAEALKKEADDLKVEAERVRVALSEAEKNLHMALEEAEAAKVAEASALDQIKALSERTSVARASTSESGAKITISREEYESLSRKVAESEALADMKVAAAAAQAEAVRASENEALKRLETSRKEIEEAVGATQEAVKRAENAEAAKRAVEGELRRWREREQKKAAEAATRILAEAAEKSEVGLKALVDPLPPSDANRRVEKVSTAKKVLLPNLSGMFNRKKNHLEGEK
ncbi:WEB family protein [Acorus calamus]|uniref:WEB family protein n=1 Tax=Acorus calamus TaxID=4465 RepID=A0AAV9CUH4_ACOCL|nr:WEB family protein [Acorus calamus]